ncbi:MAG TPA: UPF0182 family protein [Syntrophomonadaceae bacterium]|nr:UPF0182 family protein [Syntrophomonadaceae bacterium]
MDKGKTGLSGIVKLIIFLVVIALVSVFINYYTEWLWFQSINFESVFQTILLNKIAMYVVIFLLTFFVFFGNLLLTKRNTRDKPERPQETEEGREIIYLEEEKVSPWSEFLSGKRANWLFFLISAFGAFIVSSVAADNWLVVQQFINKVAFNISDPIFNKDIGFYFFDLQFLQFIYSLLMTTLVLSTIIVGLIYFLNASQDLILGDWKKLTFAKGHIAVLVALIFALKAGGYKLSSYLILFSPGGLVFGATYSDIYALLISYKALIVISLIVAVIIVVNIFVKRINWILISIGAWIVIALLLGGVYPNVVQKLIVQPNEYNKEKTFIANAIEFTRKAYSLDEVETKDFNIAYDLDINDVAHSSTLNNIRLWDWQPLTTTYKNLQQLRPYYVFNDVDIDRYTVDGEYRQLMLSARELDQTELADTAQTWVNQRLMYTHGYGLVVSPVNAVAEEGFPDFFIKDVPPKSSTDLEVTQPEIYFGEVENPYVIVNTKQKEFDYPMGETNVYSNYEGDNGIKINSFARKLMMAWKLKDYRMVLSSDITNSSQVLMNRNIVDRITMVAPYLALDSDPYIVINTDDGKLYWMVDAYTYSSKYPYSQPFDQRGNNYIRNSVKIVCDAYTGELDFYVSDPEDPMIQVYSKIFPKLYHDIEEMPPALFEHIRYPVDLFKIQTDIFLTYHMTDPNVFYNKEDLWLIPTEIVDDKPVKMEPYYIVMKIPGEEEPEYVQMLPFTPKSRQNMVAWMCARMDGDNYGNILVYRFPKQETNYGPEQIESRINQNTQIAQQLSLWDQRGSRVFRGHLLVIPIDNSILYVEPLYLQADNSRLPELKRVIVAYGNKTVMEPTLDKALLKLFGEGSGDVGKPDEPTSDVSSTTDDPVIPSTVQELAIEAKDYYDKAQELLQAGDWAGYGENIEKLNGVLEQLGEIVAE